METPYTHQPLDHSEEISGGEVPQAQSGASTDRSVASIPANTGYQPLCSEEQTCVQENTDQTTVRSGERSKEGGAPDSPKSQPSSPKTTEVESETESGPPTPKPPKQKLRKVPDEVAKPAFCGPGLAQGPPQCSYKEAARRYIEQVGLRAQREHLYAVVPNTEENDNNEPANDNSSDSGGSAHERWQQMQEMTAIEQRHLAERRLQQRWEAVSTTAQAGDMLDCAPHRISDETTDDNVMEEILEMTQEDYRNEKERTLVRKEQQELAQQTRTNSTSSKFPRMGPRHYRKVDSRKQHSCCRKDWKVLWRYDLRVLSTPSTNVPPERNQS